MNLHYDCHPPIHPSTHPPARPPAHPPTHPHPQLQHSKKVSPFKICRSEIDRSIWVCHFAREPSAILLSSCFPFNLHISDPTGPKGPAKAPAGGSAGVLSGPSEHGDLPPGLSSRCRGHPLLPVHRRRSGAELAEIHKTQRPIGLALVSVWCLRQNICLCFEGMI